LLRLACALLCGVVIRTERQWRQRTAGLRTYTLVAVGSCLFVIAGCLVPDTSSTRMETAVGKSQTQSVLKALLFSPERMDAQVEQLVSRLSLEKKHVGLSWQLLPVAKNE
jgi:uncharacterized membrane protein YhiD involved in acid resistance